MRSLGRVAACSRIAVEGLKPRGLGASHGALRSPSPIIQRPAALRSHFCQGCFMSAPRKTFSAAQASEAKRLYETSLVPITEIATMLGVHYNTLTRFAKEQGWRKRQRTAGRFLVRRQKPAPLTRAQTAQAEASYTTLPADAAERTALATRIQGVVEREIAAVEAILCAIAPNANAPDDTERAARTLASLARTLTELARLEFSEPAAPPAGKDAGNDDVPRDLEELRRALARKLADFAARTRSAAAGGDECD